MSGERLWIWGKHPVLEAVRAGTVIEVLMARERADTDVRTACLQRGVPVRETTRLHLEQLSGGVLTQGVAAQVLAPDIATVESMLERSTGGEMPFILVLDQIQDPHNLGALLRTAEAAGVHGVIMPERRSAPITGTVAKTSAGALSRVPLAYATNLARALDQLRGAGIWLTALAETGEQTVYDLDLRVPLALVLGNEGTGLRRLTRERCDVVARLPMHGTIASLNASVAGAIAMYEVVRQRAG